MARHRYLAGFWLSVAAAALALMVIGAGLSVIAEPDHPVNEVMIPALVLVAALAALFIGLAARLRGRALHQPLSLLRLVTATLILGVALVGGVTLFRHQNAYDHSCPAGAPSWACVTYVRPGWVYAGALGIGLFGLVGAAGAVAGRNQLPST